MPNEPSVGLSRDFDDYKKPNAARSESPRSEVPRPAQRVDPPRVKKVRQGGRGAVTRT
jgi:hypothetical protein